MGDYIAFLIPPAFHPSLKIHCLRALLVRIHPSILLMTAIPTIDYYAASVYVLDTHSFFHYMLSLYHGLIIRLLARLLSHCDVLPLATIIMLAFLRGYGTLHTRHVFVRQNVIWS